mmetsp:Transcript_21788/g.61650  ORF Transcript_21788/g.61650 Transcript_21788/m.61650 type:complete len:213 (+) Transcript_21788:1465-2103(+)
MRMLASWRAKTHLALAWRSGPAPVSRRCRAGVEVRGRNRVGVHVHHLQLVEVVHDAERQLRRNGRIIQQLRDLQTEEDGVQQWHPQLHAGKQTVVHQIGVVVVAHHAQGAERPQQGGEDLEGGVVELFVAPRRRMPEALEGGEQHQHRRENGDQQHGAGQQNAEHGQRQQNLPVRAHLRLVLAPLRKRRRADPLRDIEQYIPIGLSRSVFLR